MSFCNALKCPRTMFSLGSFATLILFLTLTAPTSISGNPGELKNITSRLDLPVLDNLFSFASRVAKKPFAKKNNFLSFETTNQNIEIGFEFSVPFLTVPVKRSVDTVRQTAQSVMTPLANINTGAIFLAGVMVMAGVTTTYFWRLLANMNQPDYRRFAFPRNIKDLDPSQMEQILDMMERLLKRYDIDARGCAQRLLCSTVRQAAENVASGSGSSADKVIDGVTSSIWLQKWSHGSSMQSVLQLARSDDRNCEESFANCLVSNDKLEVFVRQLLNNF